MKYTAFSQRLKSDSGIRRLMQDLGAAINQNAAMQMLGGGNPAAIPAVEQVYRAEMEKLLADGDQFERMVGNYDSPQGNDAFIQALADSLGERFAWQLGRENIAITNGSQSAFSILFNMFAGRYAGGELKKILLPMTPEYIGYAEVGLSDAPIFTANKPMIELLGDAEDGGNMLFKYRVDFDQLDIHQAIGAVCVSRPTNPTGNVITDNELGKLHRMTTQAGVPLIIDGAYGLPFPGIVYNQARPLWDENIILCLSLSKLGLPGARTGIIIAHPDVIQQVASANAIFALAPGRFGPALATRLLKSGELLSLCADIIAPYYRERSRHALRLVRQRMAGLPVRAHRAEGAIFLWLWFADLPISSERLYQRLKQRGVLVIAGGHFFPGMTERWRHRDECIRITYAADPAQVDQGIKIIAEEVRRAYAEPKAFDQPV